MTIPGTAQTLLVVGRLATFAAAAFALVLMAKPGCELFRYVSFSGSLSWAGIIPVVFALRICVAGWVAWAVLRLDGRALMRVLLAAGMFSRVAGMVRSRDAPTAAVLYDRIVASHGPGSHVRAAPWRKGRAADARRTTREAPFDGGRFGAAL